MKAIRNIQFLGYTLFALLTIAALWLYKERVLYVDSAYYAFNMLNEGHPVAEHNRYALYIYQLLPWAMMKAGFAVSIVLRTYSVSHILLHIIAFIILLRIRQPLLALILLIMQIIGYRECFFLTVNETALAISATLTLAGCLSYFKTKQTPVYLQFISYITCIGIGFFSHPMAMIIIPFVIAYHWINQGNFNNDLKQILILFLSLIVVFICKKLISKESGYENDLFAQLGNTTQILSNLKDVYSFKFFTGEFKLQAYFFSIYIMPTALAVYCIFRYIREKQYRQLAFYLLSIISFWFIIIIFFNRGDGNIFMEKNFTPWILVAIYPLKDLLKIDGEYLKTSQLIVFVAIIGYSIFGVLKVTPMYQKRMYLMDDLITVKNEGKSKLILQDSMVNHEEWLGIWALPYESILLSKVKKLPPVTAKIYHNEKQINKELYRKDIFIGADFIPVLPDTFLIRNPELRPKQDLYHPIKF